jgi:predicted AlkP superfamily phosphohydrolase/phosphomutase
MIGSSTTAHTPRVLVVGLDGATFTWLRPLAASNRLPTLCALMESGASGSLESIIPPHTGPAWPSMITGRNPGKHGIFYFERYDVANYACLDGLSTSEPLIGQTIFDIASEAGLRVAALRVPMTYPAWPVNGVMASGYPSPGETDRYAYPRALTKTLPPMAAVRIQGCTPEDTHAHLLSEIEVLTTAACQLLANDQYDLFMMVYQQPDQAHHFFWRYTDPESPLYNQRDAAMYGDLIARCYEAVDAALARVLAFAGEDTLVLVVSDHGAECAPAIYFQANRWLQRMNLLTTTQHTTGNSARALFNLRHLISKDVRVAMRRVVMGSRFTPLRTMLNRLSQDTLGMDWARTAVYRFPVTEQMEGLAINLRGRQPQGIIEPGAAYEALRERLIQELRQLRQPGTDKPLVTEVYRREEVFWGPNAQRAPDLLYRLAPGYESRGEVDGPQFTPVPAVALERHNAWHDRAGVLIGRGPGIPGGQQFDDAHLLDIAPTILQALGVTAPADMDGSPLLPLLAPTARPGDVATAQAQEQSQRDHHDHDVRVEVTAPQAHDERATSEGQDTMLTSSEEESIRIRLQGLGYL